MCSGRSARGLRPASYLGNHSDHLWRATELNPAVYGPGATNTNTNQRRTLYLQNPAQGLYYGTIGQIDDTGRSNYNAMLLSLQRPLRDSLSVLGNYTLSKCMSDPATTEITGPTIMNPADPDLDYAYCSSDRRHLVEPVGWSGDTPDVGRGRPRHAVFSGWSCRPSFGSEGNRRPSPWVSTTP